MGKKMNDDFFYQIRPPVRSEFSKGLKKRLFSPYSERQSNIHNFFEVKLRRAWQFGFLFVVLITALSFTYSENVRANVDYLIRVIAGFRVEERFISPIFGLGENASDQLGSGIVETTGELNSDSPAVSSIPTQSVTDILKEMPFSFELPEYIPEGFVLNDNAAYANSRDWVMLVWDSENAEITMVVERNYAGYDLPTGVDSSEQIQIHGQPALLIHGWWDENHVWDSTRRLEIHWEQDGHYYRLNYTQRSLNRWSIEPITGDIAEIEKELTQVAESIP
jgi:hypothetical protein